MLSKQTKAVKKRFSMKKISKQTRSKDIIEIVGENFRSDDSSWYGSELLYIIKIVKKGSMINARDDIASRGDGISNDQARHERYLAIIRKKDIEQTVNLVRVTLRDNQLSFKTCFDLKYLKAIDFGSEDCELLLSSEDVDHNLHFFSQSERDEVLWIVVQVCKYALHNNELSLGYSIDVDSLSYVASTSGSLSRFPVLQKMIQAQSSLLLGEFFSVEETEAESLLDELNWGSSLQGHTDLQQVLSKQSEDLNREIIDFLLQWEEMDNGGPHTNVPSRGHDHRGMGMAARMSDTREVLSALASVDVELDAVNRWLQEQIERLSEIQTNLSLIEEESGALESSWQSLSSVQEVVTLLVKKYSITDYQEQTLQSPDKVMDPVLKAASLVNIQQSTAPLLHAMIALRDAINAQFEEVADVSALQWKQIQHMTAISSQRAKLQALADKCISSFSGTAMGLYDWLLRHKSLAESGMIIKQHFNFSAILTATKSYHRRVTISSSSSSSSSPDNDWYVSIRSADSNPAVKARQVFETHLRPFVPLLEAFVDLSAPSAQGLRDAYVAAVTDRLYGPMMKQIAKDLSSTTAVHKIFTLANCNKAKAKGSDVIVLQLSFQPGGGGRDDGTAGPKVGKGGGSAAGGGTSSNNNSNNSSNSSSILTSWHAFELMLLTIMPVLEKEEAHVMSLFKFRGPETAPKAVTQAHREKLRAMVRSIFEGILHRLEIAGPTPTVAGAGVGKSSAAAMGQDGMEALAMLTILTSFEGTYLAAIVYRLTGEQQQQQQQNTAIPQAGTNSSSGVTAHKSVVKFNVKEDSSVAVAAVDDGLEERARLWCSELYIHSVLESFRKTLLGRVEEFTREQLQWIRTVKADPKAPEVLLPVAAFHSFIAQVNEMCCGQHFECVDDMFIRIAKELFVFISAAAKQSDKYIDKLRVVNFGYFIHSVKPRRVAVLDPFLAEASSQYDDALSKYQNWMVTYEFPSLASLAVRLDGIGKRVSDDELSLYIRRKDITNVIKEVEQMKSLELKVGALRKRLEKHFASDFDAELHLVHRLWSIMRDRIVGILARLEKAAALSYQITFDVGPSSLKALFDKHSSSTGVTTTNTAVNDAGDVAYDFIK